ncbi:hypothetical protein F2Q69_00055222 [Brassica cretica]|uniref:Uncharacterized protein n=1 Tax=Brassica cretica TaxID=69181 RepID=A0A8S9MYI2_BRACR|nr:hypothetical protein F2Q69_00055222 [Brassica cretica]
MELPFLYTLELKDGGSDYLGKDVPKDPTQQTPIDNFMVDELMEPKKSGDGATKR